ncbi:MAG: DNA glycosylase [Firmicutes bacterium]|nr:DNA glycosylase [Bacillota bacterium]
MVEYRFDGIRDMNLEHVFDCGQCFRWRPTDGGKYYGVAGEYACLADLDESAGLLSLKASGGSREFWADYFDLATDYGDIKKLLVDESPELLQSTESGYGIRILRQNFFETLISFIVSQNNNIPRIKKCIEAICERFGEEISEAEEICGLKLYAFPSVERLARAEVSELAELKLGYRSEYIVRAAQRFAEEGEPADYDAVLAYHGVGPKVANCIALFGLRQLDAFPIDTWVKKLMNDLYGFDEKDVKGMQKYAAERFGEYGGIAQQYLFNHYRNIKI